MICTHGHTHGHEKAVILTHVKIWAFGFIYLFILVNMLEHRKIRIVNTVFVPDYYENEPGTVKSQ